jgi:hypothetical protein
MHDARGLHEALRELCDYYTLLIHAGGLEDLFNYSTHGLPWFVASSSPGPCCLRILIQISEIVDSDTEASTRQPCLSLLAH